MELELLFFKLGLLIQHLVFEDNYDTGNGDIYSVRQICDQFYIRGACSLSLLPFIYMYIDFALN